MKVIGNIYEETDYSKFKKLEHNRPVLLKRVNMLKASFQEKEILNPIVVNERMEIIDGQGRYEALKQLGRPIRYVVEKDADIKDCQRMNKCNKPWTPADFVESYSSMGNENYVRLVACRKRTGFDYSRCVELSGHAVYTKEVKNTSNLLESGKLIFTESDSEKVFMIRLKGNEICQALAFSGRPNNCFWTAVKVATQFDGYKHERMLRNCEKNRHQYAQMARVSDQLKEFERIYNYNIKSSSGKLFFTDYMRSRENKSHKYEREEKFISTLI